MRKLSAFDIVLFDLDGTLCEYRRSDDEVLRSAFESTGVKPSFTIAEYFDEYRHGDYVEQYDDVDVIRERAFAALTAARGDGPETGVAVARAFAAERDHRNVRPLPGALEALESAATQSRVGLVTNALPGMQRPKLESLGIENHFEVCVFAGYDTAPKPSTKPFECALDAIGGEPSRSVHIGNSLRGDVGGAQTAGLNTVFVGEQSSVEEGDVTPDLRVESMVELATSLRG